MNILKTMKIPNNQKTSQLKVIVKIDIDALSSQIIFNNSKALFTMKDLLMSNQPIRKAPVL